MENPIKPNKREYSVILNGDSSVGMFPTTIEVSVSVFDDSLEKEDIAVFDDSMKETLYRFYSAIDSCNVYTKDELDQLAYQYELDCEQKNERK